MLSTHIVYALFGYCVHIFIDLCTQAVYTLIMNEINIREFRGKIAFYLKNLPISITSKGKVIAHIIGPKDHMVGNLAYTEPTLINAASIGTPDKLALAREALKVAEDKVYHGVSPESYQSEPGKKVLGVEMSDLTLYCDKCHHAELVLITHWENSEEFQVCEYCKKNIKRP